LDIDKREALTPLVKYFIIRSIFILPSCRNRHRTHIWWRRTSLFLCSF